MKAKNEGLITEQELNKLIILAAENDATEEQIYKFVGECERMRFAEGQLSLILSGALLVKFDAMDTPMYAIRDDDTVCPFDKPEVAAVLAESSNNILDNYDEETAAKLLSIAEDLELKK